MKVIVFAATGACLMAASAAKASISYEEDGKALVCTLSAGEEETLTAEVAAILNANTVTNFYKRGEGMLTITNDTTGYRGGFWVENGILRSFPQTAAASGKNPTLGAIGLEKDGCGAVHVKSGGTYAINTTKYASLYTDKTVYFEGEGYAGKGALAILRGELGGSRSTGMFGKQMIMTGDAFAFNDAWNYYAGLVGGGTLDMNRHVLSVGGIDAGVVINCANSSDGDAAGLKARVGDITVRSGALRLASDFLWYCADASQSDRTVTVMGGAKLWLNDIVSETYAKLVMKDGSALVVEAGDNRAVRTAYDALSVSTSGLTSRQLWNGEICLDTTGRINIESADASKYPYLQFAGKITGGGLSVDKNVRLILRELKSGTYPAVSTFTNGIVLAEGADLSLRTANNSTHDLGDFVFTNASFAVKPGRTYELPAFRCAGDCRFQGVMGNQGDPGTRDHRHYFPTLQFYQHSSGAFSSNVAVSAFIGLPQVKPYPADTGAKIWPYQTVSTGPEQFLIDKTWDIDVADVVAGDKFLFDGELAFSSGVTINVRGTTPARGPVKRFKIADAGKITFKGAKTVNVESERWSLEVGEDGRSLYLTYDPPGFMLLLR